ncbi:MAG: BatA domain-containing protein [Pseudomonadota bacterium]
MTPALLVPGGLAALVALAIPIVIHIARRTESRTVDFAAMRWLDAGPKPRRSLRIDERRLLALRLLLLAAMVLLLAQPVLWGVADDRRVVAVAPGTSAETIAAATSADDRIVWLAPGFPAVGGPAPAPSSDLISLIRQLDADLAPETPIAILAPAVLNGVDAERPRLSRRIGWRIGPAIAAPTVRSVRPPELSVRYAEEAETDVRYFRAAATAWTAADAQPAFDAAPTSQALDTQADALIWLAPGALPPAAVVWIRNGGAALVSLETRAPVEGETTVAWRDPVGEPLAVVGRLGKGRVIRLTRPLEPAAIPQLVEPDFPEALLNMLTPPPAPARVAAADHAPLTGAVAYEQAPFDTRPWLALIIALIFLGERWMATRRARAVAP